MKTYFHAFLMCQSMFCAIPSPSQIWDEKARDKMLPMLPLVGLELGLLWAVLDDLAMLLKLPGVVTALILGAYPFVVTGYLHLDGFMDVTDAVRSCRDLDRRREILKDSHVGSFAVIGLCLLLVTQVAFLTLGVGERKILIFLPAVSRCGSALAVMTLPAMSTSQYSGQKKSRGHILAVAVMAAIFIAAGFLLCGRYGFALLACLVGYGLALRKAYRSLEGMNGDIAGYALTMGELWGLIVCTLL